MDTDRGALPPRTPKILSADDSRKRGSVLDHVEPNLPALARAQGLRDAAAQVGFDWPNAVAVFAKVDEEVAELKTAAGSAEQREELGDLLFALVNLAHHLGTSAEEALQQANDKFTRRFQAIEAACWHQGRQPQELSVDELDLLWNDVKRAERGEL